MASDLLKILNRIATQLNDIVLNDDNITTDERIELDTCKDRIQEIIKART